MSANDIMERIKVQCGAAGIPVGEPEPWSGDEYLSKLRGDDARPGMGVRVTWSEEYGSVVDYGVSAVFPWIDSQPDMGCAVFFAQPDPMSDKGCPPEPEWQSLWDLLKNPYIAEVMFFKIHRPERLEVTS